MPANRLTNYPEKTLARRWIFYSVDGCDPLSARVVSIHPTVVAAVPFFRTQYPTMRHSKAFHKNFKPTFTELSRLSNGMLLKVTYRHSSKLKGYKVKCKERFS
jgi:hypothetical protein